MLFNSIEFLLVFLPVVLAIFQLTRKRMPAASLVWLTVSSLLFYAWWEPRYLALLLASAAFNFIAGRLIAGTAARHARRLLTGVGIVANLALLGYYKYAAFIVDNVARVLDVELAAPTILLPLAISFFTFQQIAYLADACTERRAESSALRYLLFVSFFPQLIAGPIVHHKEVMGQYQSIARGINNSLMAPAIALIIIGLGKKVLLADSLALLVTPGFSLAQGENMLTMADAWVSATAYSLQLYFDFSGYCDMALGCALLFGVRLPVNFDSPYQASSIIEFWRRWHMTLSRFLRDYIYIPLGGNRKGKPRRYANLFITMFLGGLWHGAGWTFVLWGSIHGCYLIFNHAWRWLSRGWSAGAFRGVLIAASTLVTFASVMVAFVYFRAPDLQAANNLLGTMIAGDGNGFSAEYQGMLAASVSGDIYSLLFSAVGVSVCSLVLLLTALFIAFVMPNSMAIIGSPDLGFEKPISAPPRWVIGLRWRSSVPWGIALGLTLWAVLISLTSVSPFLYFQF